MHFLSDNTSGVLPQVATAFAAVTTGFDRAYGGDAISQSLDALFSQHFGRPAAAVLTSTGTAGNALALASLCAPYEGVVCHPDAHIVGSEAGAPEFFTCGAKLLPVDGPGGRIDPDLLQQTFEMTEFHRAKGAGHALRIAVVSLTQPSDYGRLYAIEDVRRICAIAHQYGAVVHMDGARFPHVVVAQGLSPAQASCDAGVDVLTYGGTKCGGFAAEAIVYFDPSRADLARLLQKRSGQTLSKMRFLASQWPALLGDEAIYRAAQVAQEKAMALETILSAHPQMALVQPRDINMIFIKMPMGLADDLQASGVAFHVMDRQGSEAVARFVTSFETSDAELKQVQLLIEASASR